MRQGLDGDLPTGDDRGAVRIRGQYEVIDDPLSPDEVLPLIGAGEKRSVLRGKSVRVTGTRLGAFKKGLECAGCGRVGSRFYVERHRKRHDDEKYGEGWHLNLYAVNPNGSETLMTRDHIVPRSKGGRDKLSNCQTMCCRCNHKKADKMPEERTQ